MIRRVHTIRCTLRRFRRELQSHSMISFFSDAPFSTNASTPQQGTSCGLEGTAPKPSSIQAILAFSAATSVTTTSLGVVVMVNN